MATNLSLTIAICTKDRLHDLWRCLRAVYAATKSERVEVLVVDDGATPELELEAMAREAQSARCMFRYVAKTANFGLFGSRIVAASAATSEVVLFLDDDADIEPDYLGMVLAHYRRDPELTGVGGVDLLSTTPRRTKELFDRMFLLNSGRAGRLSPSAQNGSMGYWPARDEPFESEFLSGCNMSFRRAALADLANYSWLAGYSLGEDLILSHHASRHGKLLIDPGLRVRHRTSVVNRMQHQRLMYYAVVNGYKVARVVRPSRTGQIATAWSIVGMILKSAIQPGRLRSALAGLRGVWHLARDARNKS